MTATPRSKERTTEDAGLPSPAPADAEVVLERGARIPLTVTVLRFMGPWVHLNVCGELIQVLRSRLVKEINPDGC